MSIGSGWSGRTHEMVWFGEKKLAFLTLSDPIPTNCRVPLQPNYQGTAA